MTESAEDCRMVRRRDITVRVSRLTMSDLASKDMTSRCKQKRAEIAQWIAQWT